MGPNIRHDIVNPIILKFADASQISPMAAGLKTASLPPFQ
jgi:hypothetical protein